MWNLSKKITVGMINLGLVLLCVACHGNSLVQGFDESLVGNQIVILATHHPEPDENGDIPDYDVTGGKSFQNNLGYTITLTHATISYQQLKMISEGDDPECEAGFDEVLALNTTYNLLGADLETSLLGTFLLADRSFCQFELSFGPLDTTEPLSLQAHSDEEVTSGDESFAEEGGDQTLQLEGTWSKDSASGDFDIHVTELVTITEVFSEDGEARPFHFEEGEVQSSLLFEIHFDEFFHDMDFSGHEEHVLEEQVIENIERAFHL